MKVELIESSSLSGIQKATEASRRKSGVNIEKIVRQGHLSIIEHAFLSFWISGISRACSHQLVRKRIGVSYTQESQRYVDPTSSGDYEVIPDTISTDPEMMTKWRELTKMTNQFYARGLKKDIPKEDLRFKLPNSTRTSLIFSANPRALFDLFDWRYCTRAQWEILTLAKKMYELSLDCMPEIFSCWEPRCPDYADTCQEVCSKPIEL